MSHWNRGFLLADALLAVMITISICSLCFAIYRLIDHYEDSYDRYQKMSNLAYEEIYRHLRECEACMIDESD